MKLQRLTAIHLLLLVILGVIAAGAATAEPLSRITFYVY